MGRHLEQSTSLYPQVEEIPVSFLALGEPGLSEAVLCPAATCPQPLPVTRPENFLRRTASGGPIRPLGLSAQAPTTFYSQSQSPLGAPKRPEALPKERNGCTPIRLRQGSFSSI